ncbi:MAG: hypothetical protein ABF306_01390 [Nocardioides marinisabuli]|uniref:hypothetical protein n=1 Tax=Nocardioides marinisabuli TaxID=419476 RepID=UPI00321B7B47
MIDLVRASRQRCLLVWAGATAAAALALAVLVPAAVASTAGAAGFDDLLVRACTAALALCTAWAWLSTTVVVREARAGRVDAAARRGVPQGLRRLVLRACGLALAGATVVSTAPTATATPDHLQQGTAANASLTDPLVGLPLPERAVGPAARPISSQVRVEPGDTLWGLCAERLVRGGHAPTDAAVAACWPRVHAANRDLLGDDPDLLHPGQALRLPPA